MFGFGDDEDNKGSSGGFLDTLNQFFGGDKVTTTSAPTTVRDDMELKPTDKSWSEDLLKGVNPAYYDKQAADKDYYDYVSNDPNSSVREPSFMEKAYKAALGGIGSVKSGIHDLGLGIGKASPYLAGLAPVAGSIIGYNKGSELRDQSQQAYKDMMSAAGQNVQVGPSAAEDLEDSEEDLQARANAMKVFQDRASMGLTPEDQAMLKQARQQGDEAFQSNLAKQQTELARRGMSQSPGMAAVQAQQTAQDIARRQSEEADRQAQMSFQQKMGAAGQLGSMASSNLQQDFSRGLAKAQSADEIAKFNAQQQQARANRMVNAGALQGSQLGQAASDKMTAFGKMGEGVGTVFSGIANQGKPAQTASTAPTININTQQPQAQQPQQQRQQQVKKV